MTISVETQNLAVSPAATPPLVVIAPQGAASFVVDKTKKWSVYTLSDSSGVRYVGTSVNPRHRFNKHLTRVRQGGMHHRDCWIRLLLANGERPVLVVVEEGIPFENRLSREAAFIGEYRKRGCNLTNLTDGGEGAHGRKRTPEERATMSARAKRQMSTPEAREWFAERSRAMWRDPQYRAKSIARMKKWEPSQDVRRRMSEAARVKFARMTGGERISLAGHLKKYREELRWDKMNAVTSDLLRETWQSVTDAAECLGIERASIRTIIRRGGGRKGRHKGLMLHYTTTARSDA